MSEKKNLRNLSKGEFLGDQSRESINAGSLQRIADACELMAKNHAALIGERDRYERYYRQEAALRERRDRQISSLRGQVTKLKNQLKSKGD